MFYNFYYLLLLLLCLLEQNNKKICAYYGFFFGLYALITLIIKKVFIFLFSKLFLLFFSYEGKELERKKWTCKNLYLHKNNDKYLNSSHFYIYFHTLLLISLFFGLFPFFFVSGNMYCTFNRFLRKTKSYGTGQQKIILCILNIHYFVKVTPVVKQDDSKTRKKLYLLNKPQRRNNKISNFSPINMHNKVKRTLKRCFFLTR